MMRCFLPVRFFVFSAIYFLFLTFGSLTSFAGSVSPYADDRVRAWSKSFIAGDFDKVKALAEADLLSSSQHMFSRHIWVACHRAMGALRTGWEAEVPGPLLARLGTLPELIRLHQASEWQDAYVLAQKVNLEIIDDPFTLFFVSRIANKAGDLSLQRAADQKAIFKFPSMFLSVWNVEDEIKAEQHYLDRVLTLVKTDPQTLPKVTSDVLSEILGVKNKIANGNMGNVDHWIKSYPNDAYAFYYRASLQIEKDQIEQALKSSTRAWTAYPFRRFPDFYSARYLIQLNKYKAAHRLIAQVLPGFLGLKGDELTSRIERYYASSLQKAGEYGRARDVLKSALKRWPDDLYLNRERATLEKFASREADALPFARKAADHEQALLSDHELLISLLDDLKKFSEVKEQFAVTKLRFGRISIGIYKQVFYTFSSLKKTQERVNLAMEALAKFPQSESIHIALRDALLKAKKPAAALKVSNDILLKFPPDANQYDDHLVLVRAVKGKKAFDELIEGWKSVPKYNDNYWTGIRLYNINNKDLEYVEREKANNALYLEALNRYPNAERPYIDAHWQFVEKKNYAKAISILEEMKRRFPKSTAYANNMFEIIKRRRQDPKETVSDADWVLAESYLKKTKDKLENYYEERFRLNIAFGKEREAIKDLKNLLRINPENNWLTTSDAINLSSMGVGIAFKSIYRSIERKPMDGEKYKWAIERHAKWGGSKIYAYTLLEKLKSIDPDIYEKTKIKGSFIFDSFGLGAKSYEIAYSGVRSISNSERYIGWFNQARKNAYKDQTSFKVDPLSSSLRITYKDGTVREQRDDPICGKRIWLKTGSVWMKATYSKDCLIQKIERSDGHVVALNHDDAGNLTMLDDPEFGHVELGYDKTAQIVSLNIKNPKGNTEKLSFVYNDMKKPIVIAMEGFGSIKVEYDDKGIITSVNSSQGYKIALKITQSFQTVTAINAKRKAFQSGILPENEIDQAAIDKHLSLVQDATDVMSKKKAQYQYIQFLSDHVTDHKSYGNLAEDDLTKYINDELEKDSQNIDNNHVLQLSSLLYGLYAKKYPFGLSREKWKSWSEIQTVFSNLPGADSLLTNIAEKPLRPSDRARWLQRSYIDNDGYWRKYTARDYAGIGSTASLETNTVFMRRDGSLIIGTNKGLYVKQQGSWLRFIYDEETAQFRLSNQDDTVKASSNILSLTESKSGALWLGTANGLIRVAKLGKQFQRWQSKHHGVPSPRIVKLVPFGDGVAVGTSLGLTFFDKSGVNEQLSKLKGISGIKTEIIVLRSKIVGLDAETNEISSTLLIGTQNNVLSLKDGQLTSILNKGVNDAILYMAGKDQPLKIMTLSNNELFQGVATDLSKPIKLFQQAGKQDVLAIKIMYGFSELKIGQSKNAQSVVSVMTDAGLSFWHDNHFEHKKLPLSDGLIAVRAMSSQGESQSASEGLSYAIVSDNNVIYTIENQQIRIEKGSAVQDLITDPVLKATYIARDGSLEILFHKKGKVGQIENIGYYDVQYLELSTDGYLVFNDGNEIFRLKRGSDIPQKLFDAETSYEALNGNSLTSLLAASDGSVWATQNGSVFRWKNGEVKEFNFFLNKATFPLPNNWLSRVLETADGRIWVVASHENHIEHEGYSLKGGLLEWREDKFVLLDPKRKQYSSKPWFITGYTKLDNDRAIAGTTDGFAMHRGGELELFSKRKDKSYTELLERNPSLFLGRRGARLGDSVWLLPSAGGIVAYNKGQWFYPDRLNWMLPDYDLHRYGAKTVHAVATDEYGKIYVGTDRGLLVYNSGGGDAVSFLVSNKQGWTAFMHSEQEKLRHQRDIFLKGLKKSDPRYKQIQVFNKLQGEIDELDQRLAHSGPYYKNQNEKRNSSDNKIQKTENNQKPSIDDFDRDLFEKRLKRKKKKLTKLLLRLETKSPGLMQLLQLKPLELAALQKEIKDGDAFVQFLPTKDKLYILYISKNERLVHEETLSKKELYSHIKTVTGLMKLAVDDLSKDNGKTIEADKKVLTQELHWLYNKLIFPLRSHIHNSKRIFFVPVGGLTYLPFSALVEKMGDKPVYLAEKVTVGQMPSMYLFNLAMRHQASMLDQVLIFGDPDGSLKGARVEATSISKIIEKKDLDPVLKIGKSATLDELEQEGPLSKTIHLATHGILDGNEPQKSFLVLADNRRLSMVDIELLDLKNTDLVFLSACETGVGGRGYEFATLARAFSHAGVPSVIATLWKVDDQSTAKLSEYFYKDYEDDPLTALTIAKRKLINSDKYSHPAAWSGFVSFGMNY